MKAIFIEQPGPPAAMRYDEIAPPRPKRGEALLRVAAVGVNYIDVYHRSGVYPVTQRPFIPGMEGAGAVESIGPDVADLSPGDRVAYAGVLGSYAEQVVVPANKLVRIPDGVSFQDAAALMLQGLTAHYLVDGAFHLERGHTALVHAGAGGVGLLLTQLAKARGATVLSTVSSQAKEETSKQAGADHVIRYTSVDFAAEAKRLTGGRGVDVVYDSVGKDTFAAGFDALRRRGMMVLFGGSSGQVPPFDPQVLSLKGSLFLTRPTLADYIADRTELERRSGELFRLVLSGALRLRIEQTYPLAQAAKAHADLESRKTSGKLLLIP